tara:strand:- start:33 stop:632 length:600 start_codon:yes stop_codon:yes gene_type:complete
MIEHKLIKNFFSKEELILLQKYCSKKLHTDKEYKFEKGYDALRWYDDIVMNSILEVKIDLLEKETNLKLAPTYSYWRYYIPGSLLEKHFDRPACEVSVTACIKKDGNWPIVVSEKEFELEEGQAVLYGGCHEEHYRPGPYTGKQMAQVFLHYVDKNGPFPHHAYDEYCKKNYPFGESMKDTEILHELQKQYKDKHTKIR